MRETLRAAHGGVMFQVDGELCFLPASIAVKLIPMPQVGVVPGGPPELRGVALVDGAMTPVVDLRANPESAEIRGAAPMLVCAVLGESVGLVGLEVLATGFFDVAPTPTGEVRFGDRMARTFDVAAVIAKVRQGRWAV